MGVLLILTSFVGSPFLIVVGLASVRKGAKKTARSQKTLFSRVHSGISILLAYLPMLSVWLWASILSQCPRLHEDIPSRIFHIFGCVINRGLWSLQTGPASLAFAHRRPEHGVVVANDATGS